MPTDGVLHERVTRQSAYIDSLEREQAIVAERLERLDLFLYSLALEGGEDVERLMAHVFRYHANIQEGDSPTLDDIADRVPVEGPITQAEFDARSGR